MGVLQVRVTTKPGTSKPFSLKNDFEGQQPGYESDGSISVRPRTMFQRTRFPSCPPKGTKRLCMKWEINSAGERFDPNFSNVSPRCVLVLSLNVVPNTGFDGSFQSVRPSC